MPMHFVNLRLEGDYPIPTLSAVWKRYRSDAAGAWEMVYQERIQRPCNLARCLAEYFSTYYHRQERGLIFGGVYVTRIARFNGLIDLEPAGMEAFHPVRLDRRTVLGMRIAQTFPRLGLRFSLVKGKQAHIQKMADQVSKKVEATAWWCMGHANGDNDHGYDHVSPVLASLEGDGDDDDGDYDFAPAA
ncbi:hypothetical protein E3N88_40852 [Mikania micrantha]|uniref:Uncharacterized protein n=1 Tax=Mikania micrantha TaxID=192012 RepID=A0A5N6LNX1_9ASTR|nr:hypothetical protein E3N88_40852 [Mikania micrantha]